MKLSKEEVEHIAHLARIEITEEEKRKYSEQLSEILDYVGQLNELDTSKVAPTARVTDIVNVWREDKIEEREIETLKLLANTPGRHENYIKVKTVLE